jgi:hypothetical protein
LILKLYDLQELLPFKVDNNVLFHANICFGQIHREMRKERKKERKKEREDK